VPVLAFAKSSYSGGKPDQECVEVARNIPGVIAVRDSKAPKGPTLRIAPVAWAHFLQFSEVAEGRNRG
jgi:hypothetical protein